MELLILATRPPWAPFALIGLVLAGLAGVYFGWINLQQAKALTTQVRPSQLGSHWGQVVTVRGRPESGYRGSDPFFGNWLWYRKRYQEYQRRYGGGGGRRGSWRTVRTEEANWDLTLHLEGGVQIQVRNQPTELHGSRSETLGGGFGADYRTLVEFLPRGVPALTVCGLLSGGAGGGSLGPAPRVGLLYSVNTPEEQASRETIKGWALIAGAPALCAGLGAYLMLM